MDDWFETLTCGWVIGAAIAAIWVLAVILRCL